jgi:hypothetical protein
VKMKIMKMEMEKRYGEGRVEMGFSWGGSG